MIIQSTYRVDLMETIQPTSMHTMMIQGDAEANRILLEVYQGGLPYDLTGSGCVATVIRADAAEVPITGAVAGNAMYIDLPQEAYACDGRIIIIMRNVQGQSDVSLFYGVGTVLIGAAGTVINPGGRIPNLAELMAQMDAMADATAAAVAELAGLGEQISYFSELSARLGAKTVYADLPGIWRTDGTLNPNAGVHTRLIPVKGYTKIYGRTSMDHWGVAVAYFDAAGQYMPDVSIPGNDSSPGLRFGNNSETDPLTIPESAYYCSISGWGEITYYPILFWGPLVPNAENDGFDPGVLSTGTISHRGVSYIDFGARLDGVHDDTDAVIACHSYANAHGCPVYNHRGIVYMGTAAHGHNVNIKTDVDWTGTTFLIKPPIQDEKIVFAVSPDSEPSPNPVTLTASEIAQLKNDALNIGFLRAYPNELLTFSTDIIIGTRDGDSDYTEPSYYSEAVAVDRNGALMDGHLFLDMSNAGSITMTRRSIMDKPITIKGGRFQLAHDHRFVNPYYLYITRSNVTIIGLQCDAGERHEEGISSYRAELIRANYAYNLCFRDCIMENFTNFFPSSISEPGQVSYVLVCTHCSGIQIDHCQFLRGWGPIQTSFCKRLTARDSVMGRIDNHYGCRDYLIDGCTMVTSHSNINVGYGDGYLTIRDTKFIKTRDYDTIHNSRLVYCREDFCSIFQGVITLENIYIETNYETTLLYAALESSHAYKKAASNRILPLAIPKVRMRNIYFTHLSDEPVKFTLAEYGVRAEASALQYGSVEPDHMLIDGVWSDQAARLLPMLENVSRMGTEDWMIKVRNYDCAITVEKDVTIAPGEDLDVDLALIRLFPDPDGHGDGHGDATVEETLDYLNID